MEDPLGLLNRPHASQGFRALLDADPNPMDATGFQAALGYANPSLPIDVRKEWRRIGVLVTEENRRPVTIRLSDAGRVVARIIAELEAAAPGLIDRPRAARALLAIHEKDPEPASPGLLRRATGYSTTAARDLRDDLERLGVVRVQEEVEGRIRYVRITLTASGKRAATILERLDTELAAAHKALRS